MHMHRFEKIWLTVGVGSLIVFLIVLGFYNFAKGHETPEGLRLIDPQLVDKTPPFDDPGLRELADGTLEVNIVSHVFSYTPNKITIPKGKKVVFNVTTKDVVHSFTIPGTNVNMMVVPGYINSQPYTFKEAGNYLIICNEYCGAGHHLMKMEIEVTN